MLAMHSTTVITRFVKTLLLVIWAESWKEEFMLILTKKIAKCLGKQFSTSLLSVTTVVVSLMTVIED